MWSLNHREQAAEPEHRKYQSAWAMDNSQLQNVGFLPREDRQWVNSKTE